MYSFKQLAMQGNGMSKNAASVADFSSQGRCLQSKKSLVESTIQRKVVKGNQFEQYKVTNKEKKALEDFINEDNKFKMTTTSVHDDAGFWRLDNQSNSGSNFSNYQIQRNIERKKGNGKKESTTATNVLVYDGATEDEFKEAHRNSFKEGHIYRVGSI